MHYASAFTPTIIALNTLITPLKSTRRNPGSKLVTKYNTVEVDSLQKIDCD